MNVAEFEASSIPEPNSGCWLWLRATNPDGYGVVYFRGKTIVASRAAYIIHKGEIPAGLFVLHSCDNPPCVNPDHLRVGTRSDNAQDMVKRKRMNSGLGTAGELNGNSRLSLDQINEIRETYQKRFKRGIFSELARQYGVGRHAIRRICIGQRWKAGPPVGN